MKKIASYALFVLSFALFLSGCASPKVVKFSSTPGNRPCVVEVEEKRAEGNCATPDGRTIPFELWSVTTVNYRILAQGPDSNEPFAKSSYGLRIDGAEQGPSDEHWKRYLKDPQSLCSKTCGGDWRSAE